MVANEKDLPQVSEVLKAYEFFQNQLLSVDLVILCQQPDGYSQELSQRIRELSSSLRYLASSQTKPSLFILIQAQLNRDEIILLKTVARIVIRPQSETGFIWPVYIQSPHPATLDVLSPQPVTAQAPERHALEYDNGLGGFGRNGTEYEIYLSEDNRPAAPWTNVLCNDQFGTIVTETGGGYTWANNSQANKLTTWSNDPVIDPPSEAIYIRDNDLGRICSPVYRSHAHSGSARVRHGFGYTIYENEAMNLRQIMRVHVAESDPVKLSVLTLKNCSSTHRRLTLSYYAEWVLGGFRDDMAAYLLSGVDLDHQILWTRSAYGESHSDSVACLFASEPLVSWTSDRQEFYGLAGNYSYPRGVLTGLLSKTTSRQADPCGQSKSSCNWNQVKPRLSCLGWLMVRINPRPSSWPILTDRLRKPGLLTIRSESIGRINWAWFKSKHPTGHSIY